MPQSPGDGQPSRRCSSGTAKVAITSQPIDSPHSSPARSPEPSSRPWPTATREIADDDLARALTESPTNFDKVKLVESHLRAGDRLELVDGSDAAAQDRIVAIIQDPAAELARIKAYVTESLRRLYNQRNTVAHAEVELDLTGSSGGRTLSALLE